MSIFSFLRRFRQALQSWCEARRSAEWAKRRDEIIAHIPLQGAVRYALYLIGYRVPWEQVPDWLLRSGLKWYWVSWSLYEDPASSSPTLLTEATKQHLSQEIAEHLVEAKAEGYGRSFEFYGFLPFTEEALEKTTFVRAIQEFEERGSGPVEMLMRLIGDDETTFLYVRRELSEEVKRLLEGVGVDLTSVTKKVKVKSLKPLP